MTMRSVANITVANLVLLKQRVFLRSVFRQACTVTFSDANISEIVAFIRPTGYIAPAGESEIIYRIYLGLRQLS